jgi:hypothetical protein
VVPLPPGWGSSFSLGIGTRSPRARYQGGPWAFEQPQARRLGFMNPALRRPPPWRGSRSNLSHVSPVRARVKIGLQNLAYNIRRLMTLERIAAASEPPRDRVRQTLNDLTV